MILSKEEVEHVANLARINVSSEDIVWYQKQLGDILTEIEKIIDVDIKDEGIMISSVEHKDRYKEDVEGNMLKKEDIFKNAKNTSGGYIVVPKVLND